MQVTQIRHAWPEKKGFCLEREHGAGEYILLHFWQPMHILCDEGLVQTKPYALIIYDEHTPQKFYNFEQDITHDWIHIAGDTAVLMERYDLKPNHVYYPENSRFITKAVREMESEFFARGLYFDDVLDIKLRELFAKISRHIHQGSTAVGVEPHTEMSLKQLRQTLFSSLGTEIDVPQMARMVNLSESRFYVLYKSLFGVTPNRDLIYARTERAKFLLTQKEYSVSEVAKMTGYANEYHFIRQFKQMTGVTPGKYRP